MQPLSRSLPNTIQTNELSSSLYPCINSILPFFKPHLVRTQRKLPQFQILFSLSEVFPPQDISAIGLSALLFIQLNGEMRKNSKINKNKNFSESSLKKDYHLN